jgi:iron-sulfur cluster assembly protein
MNISLTDAAVMHIKNYIKQNNPKAVFRIGVETTGCSGLKYVTSIVEKPDPTDIEIIAKDLKVYMDVKTKTILENTVIDCEKKNLLPQLIFRNPNAVASCGCGESFTVKNKEKKDE